MTVRFTLSRIRLRIDQEFIYLQQFNDGTIQFRQSHLIRDVVQNALRMTHGITRC